MNNTPAVIVNIQRQPGANVIEVVDHLVKALMPQLPRTLPAAVKVSVVDQVAATTIRESVKDVQFELLLAVVLVVLAIFLFLRNLDHHPQSVGSALLAGGTFGAMYLLGLQPQQPLPHGPDHLHRLRSDN